MTSVSHSEDFGCYHVSFGTEDLIVQGFAVVALFLLLAVQGMVAGAEAVDTHLEFLSAQKPMLESNVLGALLGPVKIPFVPA